MQTKHLKPGADYAYVSDQWKWNNRTRYPDRGQRVTVLEQKASRERVLRTYSDGSQQKIVETGALIRFASGDESIVSARGIRMPWADWEVEREQILEDIRTRKRLAKEVKDLRERQNDEIRALWPETVIAPTTVSDPHEFYRQHRAHQLNNETLLALLKQIAKEA